jgi:Indoleamine 2,3-dioxygenase
MISQESSPRSSQGKAHTRSSTSTLDPNPEQDNDTDWLLPNLIPQVNHPLPSLGYSRDQLFSGSFENFCSVFNLDSKYGTCRDYQKLDALPECFSWIEELIMQPKVWRTKASLVNHLKGRTLPGQIPELSDSQALRLVTATFHLINVYCFCKEETEAPAQKIPAIIAVPHILGCKKLRLGKYSLGFGHLWACWKISNPDNSIYNIENLEMLISFTDEDGDRVFNGLSIVLAFCLQEVNKLLFKVSSAICEGNHSHIAEDFHQASDILYKFIPQMKQMFDSLSKEFFIGEYRNYLRGFDNKELFPEGVEFEDTGINVSSVGGSAGNDPSVQIFERFMGIKYSGIHDTLQTLLKQGFQGAHADCIDFLEENHVIRDFLNYDVNAKSDMIEGYNELLLAFAAVFRKHYSYIHNYLVDRKPTPLHPGQVFGTGGIRAIELGQKSSLIEGFSIHVQAGDPKRINLQTQPFKPLATDKTLKMEDSQNQEEHLNDQVEVKPRGCPFGFS